MLTPERRAELREYAAEWLDVSAVNIFPDVLLALLDAADERDRLAAQVERLRARLVPRPDDFDFDRDPRAYLPITEDADGLTCDICGAELADWAAADEHIETHEGWAG